MTEYQKLKKMKLAFEDYEKFLNNFMIVARQEQGRYSLVVSQIMQLHRTLNTDLWHREQEYNATK